MDKPTRKGLDALLSRRENFIQLLLVAALLAFGVDVLAGALTEAWRGPRIFLFAAGVVIVFASVWPLLTVLLRECSFATSFEACFLFDPTSARLVDIEQYYFSEKLGEAVRAVLVENDAFRRDWQAEPVHPAWPDGRSKEPKSASLLREAIEYVLLEKLSVHLSDYFHNFPDTPGYTRTYERQDVPALLLQNRVLSLLTSPPGDRAPFGKDDAPPDQVSVRTRMEGRVEVTRREVRRVMGVFTSAGAIYNRFELTLPKDTIIARPEAGKIVFENNRISLTMGARFEGMDANVPFDFLSDYMGVDPVGVGSKQVRILIEYRAKSAGLLRRSGWEYHRWVDSFAAEVERDMSFPEYMRRINWDSLSVLLASLKRRSTIPGA